MKMLFEWLFDVYNPKIGDAVGLFSNTHEGIQSTFNQRRTPNVIFKGKDTIKTLSNDTISFENHLSGELQNRDIYYLSRLK